MLGIRSYHWAQPFVTVRWAIPSANDALFQGSDCAYPRKVCFLTERAAVLPEYNLVILSYPEIRPCNTVPKRNNHNFTS